MTLRFFFLQAHYSSTLDLNDASLQSAEKGYARLLEAYNTLSRLSTSVEKTDSPLAKELEEGIQSAFAEMDDDFNVPKALARLFELCPLINKLSEGQLNPDDAGQHAIDVAKKGFEELLFGIFGLKDENAEGAEDHMQQLDGLMQLVIDIRQQARQK